MDGRFRTAEALPFSTADSNALLQSATTPLGHSSFETRSPVIWWWDAWLVQWHTLSALVLTKLTRSLPSQAGLTGRAAALCSRGCAIESNTLEGGYQRASYTSF